MRIANTSTGGDRSWRSQARTVVLWSWLTALTMVVVAAAVVWSWRDALPDPLASHWGMRPAAPDGFMSLRALVLATVLMVVLPGSLAGAVAWFWGRAATTRRMAAASCVWFGGFGAGVLLLLAGAQRGLDDATRATLPGWTVAATLVLPLGPAVVAALLVGGDRHEPAAGPVAADAARITLAGGERAVWIRRAAGGPGRVVGAAAMLVVTLLAVALRQWALLTVPVALIAVFAIMFAFTVRVDATGLTVRSLAGWPAYHVPADEVERASVTEVHPMRQFGGWGWRVGRGGRVGIVLRSGGGLLVQQSGDRSFVVTVDDAATGAALLNTLADRARSGPVPR
ncbi:DUF1648 domain-containing protein [Actinoplanes teichomyceticus]|uniref:DUF1648 domain-containing protein n=1 Tax=Actinoplanes teichomyceticus TaxID=1867 RepID=A0A561WNL7_ACTTI|nr:DUF1648 domain-containing protein [Actinoplanes teichomyceticus]TWG25461.1 hypothetical protein FHX34_101430 [Actinoplanes teichomyceticus]GIF10530.1 hypothetical protein Ate01nite_05620 [Actinoplanes teichomyceticus]